MRNSVEKEKKRRKILLFGSIAAAVVVALTAIVIISYYYMNRTFSGYDVEREITREDSNNVEYLSYHGKLLKYSRDGISALDKTGNVLWNGGYEMQQPQVDICEDYVVVADIGSKTCIIYDGTNPGKEIETTLPIGRAKVSADGKVAVLLHDDDSDVINIYDPFSAGEQLLVEIPSNVLDDGYAMDLDLAPDGESIVISYLVAANGTMENKVCFYNFTEVGQDQNTLVGGKSFEQKMISQIEYLDSDRVVIFTEDGFTIFKDMKKPGIQAEVTLKEEIKSIAVDDENILIVTGVAGNIDDQVVHLYTLQGKEKMTKQVAIQYSQVEMTRNEILFTGNQNCFLLRKNGTVKFSFDFGKNYDYFFPTTRENQYFFLDETTIRIVKLSG